MPSKSNVTSAIVRPESLRNDIQTAAPVGVVGSPLSLERTGLYVETTLHDAMLIGVSVAGWSCARDGCAVAAAIATVAIALKKVLFT